jgi:uncharacterized RDD family membrane protein YckC
MRYAGFWSRLWAMLVDGVLLGAPLYPLMRLQNRSWLVALLLQLPLCLLQLAYNVYCHGRWGQTVGKMVAKIRVVNVDARAISWRQAFLRSSVDAVINVTFAVSMMTALSRIGPDEYFALAPPDRWQRIVTLAPFHDALTYASWGWFWGELVVLLFNRRKRALHDFIAGTVVVHTAPAPAPDPDRLGILPLLDRR